MFVQGVCVLWSIRGSYPTVWSFPHTNVKWHSVTWPYTMTTPYRSDFIPNSTFYRILSGFHRTFATGVACRQGTLTPPDTWSCPIWDLQMFFCWDHWHSITNVYITPVYDTFPWFDFLPNLTLLLNIGFHRASATGVACRQGTLTPPDTWSRPLWDLHMFYLLRPILFRTCRYFTGLCFSNIPRYFLDFASSCVIHVSRCFPCLHWLYIF